MPQPSRSERETTTINVNRTTHQAARIAAAQRNVTVKDFAERAIQRELRRKPS